MLVVHSIREDGVVYKKGQEYKGKKADLFYAEGLLAKDQAEFDKMSKPVGPVSSMHQRRAYLVSKPSNVDRRKQAEAVAAMEKAAQEKRGPGRPPKDKE